MQAMDHYRPPDRLFDPVKGFHGPGQGTRPPVPDQIDLDGTDGPVHIYYDERLVPAHIC